MDLVDYREDVFEQICADFRRFASQLRIPDIYFIPVSALLGENVVAKSEYMPWFGGASLLHHLETVHIASDRNLTEMRFPVQVVLRPSQDFRGYAGQVASGVIKPGDQVMILPSGHTSHVKSITTYDGDLDQAFPPMSITVCLEDEVDISRGSMLAPPTHQPHVVRCIDARLVWMDHQPLDLRKQYIVKHTTQSIKAQVQSVRYRVDVNTLEKCSAADLKLNEVGAVVIDTHAPLFVDAYLRNRVTGSFILIDPISNATAAAGMITGRDPASADVSSSGAWLVNTSHITPAERKVRIGHASALIWVNGDVAIAHTLARKLFDRGLLTHVVAPQSNPTFLLQLLQAAVAAGLLTICPADLLYEVERERAQALIASDQFFDWNPSRFEGTEQAINQLCQILEDRGIVPSRVG